MIFCITITLQQDLFSHFCSGQSYIEVYRFRPENSFDEPEVLTTFTPKKTSLVHSFSITEDYVVFFFYPLDVDPVVRFLIFLFINQSLPAYRIRAKLNLPDYLIFILTHELTDTQSINGSLILNTSEFTI